MQIEILDNVKTIYLTPTEQYSGIKGIKLYIDGKWQDIKFLSQLRPGDTVSIDGVVYKVTTSKTEYSISSTKKYTLPNGAIAYELPDRYYIVENNRQYTVSESRFRNMTKDITPEIIIRISQTIQDYNKAFEQKRAKSAEERQHDVIPRQEEATKAKHGEEKKETSSSGQEKLNVKALLTYSSIITMSSIYIRDEIYYNTKLKDIWDELDRKTDGQYRRVLSKATGLSFEDLKKLEEYSLTDLLSVRRDIETFLISSNQENLDKLLRHDPVLLNFILRTLTGDKEISSETLRQALDYVQSLEYRKRVTDLSRIYTYAEQELEKKSLLERYYFVKYAYEAIFQEINGMEYIENGQVKTIDFSNPGQKEKDILERLLRGNFNNNLLAYKYGLTFLSKTTRSFDNLVTSLEVVERVMLGISNSPESFGLNRLEQHRYYTEELPRITTSLYQNYASAVSSMLNRNLNTRIGNFVKSSSGLRFQDLMTVGDQIKEFVQSGKEIRPIPDAAFSSGGNVRASPRLQVPDPELITQGLLLNTSQLATRYSRSSGYFFKLPSNTWEQLRANIRYEATESNAVGSGRAELIGTRSTIIAEVNNQEIAFIARNIELLNQLMSGQIRFSPGRVSGELEAELDQRFGGANLGVVFRQENGKFNGILYAKISGNWYQLGYVDNSWIAGMDVLIPGFAAIVGNVKVGEKGIVGSIGISMPELSAYVIKDEKDLSAIAAYLLNGNQLAAGSFLGKQVMAPSLVYGGFYNSNIVAGGQYLSKDMVVSGFGIIGNGVGLKVSLGTSNFAITGNYIDLNGLSQIAAGVKTRLNDYNLFALYAATGENVLIGGGLSNNDMSLQLFRMSKADPIMFGQYSRFFQGVQGITGAYAAFGSNYLEALLTDDLRILFGGGIVLRDVEVQAAAGINNGLSVAAAQVTFPLGIYLISLGALYDSNKTIFSVSAQNGPMFFGAAYNQNKDVLVLKVRYRDNDREVNVWGNLGNERGIAASYGFWLNQRLFANLTAGLSNEGDLTGYYLGVGLRSTDNLELDLGYGSLGERYRIRLSAKAVFKF